ncbi:MAG: polyhydroxybutyrate depolymerase [Bacteroidia bacterium]|jgi:polyhydroxybutyrate depolymerase
MKSFLHPIVALIVALVSYSEVQSQTIILTADFQSGLPAGWSQQTLSTDGGWLNGNANQLQSQYWDIAPHTKMMATNDDECDCNKSADYLIMPPFNFTGLAGVVLEFENYFDGGDLDGSFEVATIEYSLDNGNNWTVLETIVGTDDDAWDSQTINLSSLIGNNNVLVAFRYFDDGGWLFGWGVDDVVVYEPTGFDAELTSIDIPNSVSSPTNLTIGGLVTNVGVTEIQSFDVNWTDGGTVNSTSISGLALGSGQSYVFSHPNQLGITTSGNFDIQVYISNINGGSDDDATNDSLSSSLTAVEYGTFTDGGLQRDYIYYHPSTAPANCPLIFVVHGYGGSAQDIMNYSEFNSVADDFGFAVCYLQGIEDSFGNTFFNVGYDFQNNETVDDVAYVENLSTYLRSTNSLDSTRVFCTGLSNGGDFCYLLACEASETFRAVAPVAGMIMQEILDACNPTNQVSIFEIHGTNDNVTYWNGDPNNNDNWGAYPSIPATIDYWVNEFGLQLQSTVNLPNIVTNDGSTVTADKYGLPDFCPQVWLYTVDGGGHDWPGAWGNMDIDVSREIWHFFDEICVDNATGLDEIQTQQDRTLIRITDVLGRETSRKSGQVLIYQYSDRSVEKKIYLE